MSLPSASLLHHYPRSQGPLRVVPESLKKQALAIKDFESELVAGTYTSGGAITIVLDMSVTDIEIGSVQHMLHMVPTFDNPNLSVCPDTGKSFDRPSLFGGCKSSAPCYWCGYKFDSEVLRCEARP